MTGFGRGRSRRGISQLEQRKIQQQIAEQKKAEEKAKEEFKQDVSKQVSELQPFVNYSIDRNRIFQGDQSYADKVNTDANTRIDFLNKYRSAGVVIEGFLNNPNYTVSRNPNGTLSRITANTRTYTKSRSDGDKTTGNYVPQEFFFDSNGNIIRQIVRTDGTTYQDRESKDRKAYDKEVYNYSNNKLSGGFINRRVRLGGNITDGIQWSIEREKDISADPTGVTRITKHDLSGEIGSRTRQIVAEKEAIEQIIKDAGAEGKVTVSELRANPNALKQLVKKIELGKEDETTRLLRLTGQLGKVTKKDIEAIRKSPRAMEQLRRRITRTTLTTPEKSAAKEIYDPSNILTGAQFSALMDNLNFYDLKNFSKGIRLSKELKLYEKRQAEELLKGLKRGETLIFSRTNVRDSKGRLILSLPGIKKELVKPIPIRTNKQVIKDLTKNTKKNFKGKTIIQIGKEIASGFFEFPLSVVRGFTKTFSQAKKPGLGRVNRNLVRVTFFTIKSNKNQGLSLSDKKILRNVLNDVKKQQKELNLQNDPDVQLAIFVGTAALGTPFVLGVGGTTAIITKVTLGAVGLFAVSSQGLQTIREPSPKNFGRLAFFAMPTAIGIGKTIGKLRPSFRPSVKNVTELDAVLALKRRTNIETLKDAIAVDDRAVIKLLKKQNKEIDLSRAQMKWIMQNKEIMKTRDYNPRTHLRFFKKLQGSYKTGIHISVSSPRKLFPLFGQRVTKKINLTRKKIEKLLKERKIKEELKAPGFPGTTRRAINTEILRFIKKEGLIVGGSKAQNIQVSRAFRRLSGDFDLISKNKIKDARKLFNILKKKFPNAKIEFIKQPNANTIKVNGKGFVDIVNESFLKSQVGIRKISTRVVGGIKILSKNILIKQKLLAFKPTKQRRLFLKRQAKDLPDVARLVEGRLKFKRGKLQIPGKLPSKRNPSGVFEVVAQPKGMGKGRIIFDETHMFFDFEAALGYSNGNKFTIIKFPLIKISKFSKSLRKRINKASSGLLSQSQTNSLRRSLNAYVKRNPSKFFLSPRTASAIIGEREIVIAEGSKFFKNTVYRTFDNDLQKFIKIIEVGFKKAQRTSLIRKFINGWKSKPFRTLKLRLTNPDVLLTRKYYRLIETDITLRPTLKTRFLNLFRKVLASKKAQVSIGVKKPKRLRLKKTIKKKKLSKKQFELEKIKKELKSLRRRKLTRQQRIRLRRKLIARRREITIARKIPKRVPKKRIPKRVPKKRIPKRVPKKRIPKRVPKKRIPKRVPRKRIPVRVRKPVRIRKPIRVRKPVRIRKPTRVRRLIRPKTPPPKTPPPKPIILNISPTIKSLRKYNKIDVLVKKRGRKFKYQRINKGYLTPKEALLFARYKLDKTRLASVVFRPSKLKKRQEFNIKTPTYKFRRSKGSRNVPKNAIVEKRKYRLDSAKEKRQIISKVKKKRPKKKRRKTKKKRRKQKK